MVPTAGLGRGNKDGPSVSNSGKLADGGVSPKPGDLALLGTEIQRCTHSSRHVHVFREENISEEYFQELNYFQELKINNHSKFINFI